MITILKFFLLLVILAAVLWLERWLIQKGMVRTSMALPFVFLFAYLLLMYFAFTGILSFHFWFNFCTEILMVPTIALIIYYSVVGKKPWRKAENAPESNVAAQIPNEEFEENAKEELEDLWPIDFTEGTNVATPEKEKSTELEDFDLTIRKE